VAPKVDPILTVTFHAAHINGAISVARHGVQWSSCTNLYISSNPALGGIAKCSLIGGELHCSKSTTHCTGEPLAA
jgi:hypothetical protein